LRAGDIKSLIWLSRWYNGRADKFQQVHDKHISNLFHLLISENGNIQQGEQSVSLSGFDILLSFGQAGLEIISIEPPETINGIQLDLFSHQEEYAEISA
jgi:hypothetical protein